MKHSFFKIMMSVFALFMISATWAQDIIVTTDAKKIEAKILEVSKSEIKYKKSSNLDGPTFVLSTDEITTVIYSNGDVQLYNQQPATTPQPETPAQPVVAETPVVSAPIVDENTAEVQMRSGSTITVQITELKSNYIAYNLNGKAYTMPASQIEKVTFLATGQEKEYNRKVSLSTEDDETSSQVSLKYVSRSGNTYYYDGKAMGGDAYSNFLRHNCSEAYKVYRSGKKISIAGWTLLAVGLGLDFGSSIAMLATIKPPYYQIEANPAMIACSLIGLGCEIACIPTLIVGYNKMHYSADVYNVSCASKSKAKAYWSINTSQNGIGLAYNF